MSSPPFLFFPPPSLFDVLSRFLFSFNAVEEVFFPQSGASNRSTNRLSYDRPILDTDYVYQNGRDFATGNPWLGFAAELQKDIKQMVHSAGSRATGVDID